MKIIRKHTVIEIEQLPRQTVLTIYAVMKKTGKMLVMSHLHESEVEKLRDLCDEWLEAWNE